MLDIPKRFLAVKYNGDRFPGVPCASDLTGGANCQVFAYELLRHFGKTIPDFRSSELWEDESFTHEVTSFEPLDLLLYNKEQQAWGAHIGVFIGDDSIIHLSKRIGLPAIWKHKDFATQQQYKYFIGAKRVSD